MFVLPAIWLLVTLPIVGNEMTQPTAYFPMIFRTKEDCIDVVARAVPNPNETLRCVKYEAKSE